jgi:hypothetical protein
MRQGERRKAALIGSQLPPFAAVKSAAQNSPSARAPGGGLGSALLSLCEPMKNPG